MAVVHETIDALPHRDDVRRIARREELLLTEPVSGPVKLWQDHPPLEVVHFSQEYSAVPFAAPRGVYEAGHLRLEWQTMDNRQPFYHRNADVDELSYQIAGSRTLITELGVVEHVPGEFSRIPVGAAHDNYGRRESHLLFYIPAPVTEVRPELRVSEPVFPAFPGWEPAVLNEMTTVCLGALGHDVALTPVDEHLLLEHVHEDKHRLKVLPAADAPGTTWLYHSRDVWIGTTRTAAGTDGSDWHRHLGADEIQYQISGHRTLVSQRGCVELGPGDFVRLPLGIAFTSVVPADEPSSHITVLSAEPIPRAASVTRTAEPSSLQRLERLRGR
ncbi:hypothetical protein [Streptomyces hokutonensis]|uniref:hypothetical protein n=1 Tax=Streptomyces hokutonensis TaxID=1306990 RepID=UPI0037F7DEB6